MNPVLKGFPSERTNCRWGNSTKTYRASSKQHTDTSELVVCDLGVPSRENGPLPKRAIDGSISSWLRLPPDRGRGCLV